MALKKAAILKQQHGMSLIELMFAIAVLTVGVIACASAIPFAIGTNYKNRQQSSSTAIAEEVMEKIMSVPAGTSPTLTLYDASGAGLTVSTVGTAPPNGTGANLQSSTQANPGDIDFSQAASSVTSGYQAYYTTLGTNGQTAVYDVRWNISTPSVNAKLIVVGAKLKGSGSAQVFALPVSIRSLVGQGS